VVLNYGQAQLAGMAPLLNRGQWTGAIFRGPFMLRYPQIKAWNQTSDPGWWFDDFPVPAAFPAYYDWCYAHESTNPEAMCLIFDDQRDLAIHIYNPRNRTFAPSGDARNSSTYGATAFSPGGSGFCDGRLGPWARASCFSAGTGLVLKSEMDAGLIEHGLSCSWPKDKTKGPGTNPSVAVAPATTSDGSGGSNGMYMGAHLQLDPTLNVDSLGIDPYYRPILIALQEYGVYTTESSNPGGGPMSIHAEAWNDAGQVSWPTRPGGGDPWWPAAAGMANHFRIVAPPPDPVYDNRPLGMPYR
jgi:hypothetical protein